MVIYAENIFLNDWVMDWLILWLAARASRLYVKRGRMVLSSFTGAVWAMIPILTGQGYLIWMTKLLLPLWMCWIAYGGKGKKSFWRYTATVFVIGLTLGGALFALQTWGMQAGLYRLLRTPLYLWGLAVVFAIWVLRVALLSHAVASGEPVEFTVGFGTEVCRCTGIIDSGNQLSEPISGFPVAVLSWKQALPALPEEIRNAFDREGEKAAIQAIIHSPAAFKFRFVPCRTVAGERMLPALKPKELAMNGISLSTRMYIAFSEEATDSDGNSCALLPLLPGMTALQE